MGPVSADGLSDATQALVGDILEAERSLREFPAYHQDAAGAYAHLIRMLRRFIEEQFLQDPEYPFFRVLDDWVREGGDNPDQRYLFARIQGGDRYRVWSNIGSANAVELQLYEGQPWAGQGRVGDYLPFHELDLDSQGDFELILTPEATGENRLSVTPATDTVLVRQIYREWSEAPPGHIHIDRLESLGKPKPQATSESIAERMRRTGERLLSASLAWPGANWKPL